MEQSRTDTWSLGTSPTITSLFQLSLNEGHSPSIDAEPFSSRRCGLGWIYKIQATNADITKPSSGITERFKCTMFKISFSAPRIASTNLNKLSLAVKASDKTTGGPKITFQAPDIPLPVPENIHIASILSAPNHTGKILVQIVIRLELSGPVTTGPPTFEHAYRGPTPPNLQLHSVVARSLLSGELGDIKFGLFTRRGGNDVTDPNIIFADRSLVHGHNAFLINGEYHQSFLYDDNTEREVVKVGDLKARVYSAYDYMSDSDLESDYDSDVVDFGDLDSHASSLLSEDFTTPSRRVQSARLMLEEHEEVILIRDAAFETWKALIFYLYTKEINFKPLTSSIASHDAEARENFVACSCSPKSMYRLATKIKFRELQSSSLAAIARDLSETNIIEELFSYFTSLYPEVQKAEVDALIPLLKQGPVVESLRNKMESVVTSGVPHCRAIVAAIMDRVVELAVQGQQ